MMAPERLSAESRELWDRLMSGKRSWTAADVETIGLALDARDRCAAGREQIARDGLVIIDRFGSPREHPAVRLVEQSARSWLACLRALQLDPKDFAVKPAVSGPVSLPLSPCEVGCSLSAAGSRCSHMRRTV